MSAVREAVVAEALGWLGTAYAHRQRLKGVGVDCAQLPLAVYAACGLIADPDVGAYAAQWHLHRGEELYLGHVLRLGGREIARAAARAGDFGLWRYGRAFSHGGVLVGGGRIVHAVRGQGVVLADLEIDSALTSRPARFFTLLCSAATRTNLIAPRGVHKLALKGENEHMRIKAEVAFTDAAVEALPAQEQPATAFTGTCEEGADGRFDAAPYPWGRQRPGLTSGCHPKRSPLGSASVMRRG